MSGPAPENLELLFSFLSRSFATLETSFFKVPGSAIVARYVKSSHQNDPGRTVLELILFLFAVRTLLQSRTRGDQSGPHFIPFDEKEIDELVDDWTPEALTQPLSPEEEKELASIPVIVGPPGPKAQIASNNKTVINLASPNFTGLAGMEEIKTAAVDTLWEYGLGSCGPRGFVGNLDVHLQLEQDIADFLGTEDAILNAQAFSTIGSVIPAFAKRGDVIVADRSVNFAIQKGLYASRCTVRWYDHNDMESLERVLEGVEKEMRKRKAPLTRRFIVTEGIFDHDGSMADLPKIVELKKKYKYRLILDESISFGSVGRTGRGLTELYNVPASEVDMLIGSMATGLASAGGFCAGSRIVTSHQRLNGPSFVYSASLPAALTVAASKGIEILRNTPSILGTLQENIRAVRAILDRVDCIAIPSHPASATIHLQIRWSNTASSPEKNKSSAPFDVELEERLLQDVVEEALSQGVLITRAKRLRAQELFPVRPSIRLAISAALPRKDCEKAASVVKAAFVKVIGKRR